MMSEGMSSTENTSPSSSSSSSEEERDDEQQELLSRLSTMNNELPTPSSSSCTAVPLQCNNNQSEATLTTSAAAAAVVDESLTKERPRTIIPQSSTTTSQSTDNANADNNNTAIIAAAVGAHQINESAPNINRRFFNGRVAARARVREERRLQLQQQQQQQQRSSSGNDGANGDSDSVDSEGNEETFAQNNNNENNNFRPTTSMSLSRRNLFTRRAISNSNIFSNNNNANPNETENEAGGGDGNTTLNELSQSMLSHTHSVTATLVDDENVVVAEAFTFDDFKSSNNNNNYNNNNGGGIDNNNLLLLPLPDSEVGRIISRLEYRNSNRVQVSNDVKNRFLRLCNEICVKRRNGMLRRELSTLYNDDDNDDEGSCSDGDGGSSSSGSDSGSGGSYDGSRSSGSSSDSFQDNNNTKTHTKNEASSSSSTLSPCILREDVIQIRNSVRLTVESRNTIQRFQSNARSLFGFRCNDDKVLLHVLNRAVDLIDESGHVEAKKRRMMTTRRMSGLNNSGTGGASTTMLPMTTLRSYQSNESWGTTSGGGNGNPSGMMLQQQQQHDDGGEGGGGMLDSSQRSLGDDDEHNIATENDNNDDNDTINMNNEEKLEWFYYKDFAFYNLKVESKYPWVRNAGVFSVLVTLAFLLFTPILWCVILRDENICPSHQGTANGWLTSLFFASATMSTVGYGDVTVLVNYDDRADFGVEDPPYPQQWKIFIATIYMILSLVVSVVGFQAGLDSHFHPFRQRVEIFGARVYEILRDANIVKGSQDKHQDIVSRMRLAKFVQLAEISLIFLILNLVGVFAVQLSLLGVENKNEYGDLSWMESLYWAVQTTTTIGYGDVEIPPSLRIFMIFYLAISTYFVGSAFGKLRDLGQKLEDMQRLYLWQQQEATYTMLADFSGRPEEEGGKENEVDELLDVEPEIDQFEFTIASLVLLGKITSEDVRPILEKFNKLSGKSNKITAADVSGPIKKKDKKSEETDNSDENSNATEDDDAKSPRQSSGSGALSVTKKIAQAFREEMFSSTNNEQEKENVVKEVNKKDDIAPDYSRFRIPTNTHAIAIDDSKIQRKLLSKFFEFAGIPEEKTTVVGDGHDEIMGFEDFVCNFIENHPEDFVFLLVDENLDVVDDNSVRSTISGSLCVENIRKRLPAKLERRMFALVRSANDSSSDIAIYSTRAHGFLPKAPIKRDKVLETLAPLWQGRFPPSEYGETIGFNSNDDILTAAVRAVDNDIACTPYDIAQQIEYIESLFTDGKHVSDIRMIHEQMHGLKGDLLTLNSTVSVTFIIGHINLILVAQSPETMLERWKSVRDHVNDILNTLNKNFRIPKNTYAIAIDDSKIQRKLLAKFFDFMDIPSDHCTVLGDGADEIKGFEDFVVNFMESHKNDYVFMVVDENLDVQESSGESISISGSVCVENIRRRLPYELERRLFALVRSANDSTSDIAIYNDRAHGFLAKAPIRREKVVETLAPLWLKRFPPAQFGDSVAYDTSDESDTTASEELACSAQDIAYKLVEMDERFNTDTQVTTWRWMHDQLHELKGDILTMASDASMISILGMINLLLGYKDPTRITEKWPKLRDRIYSVINHADERTSSSTSQATGKRWGKVRASFAAKSSFTDGASGAKQPPATKRKSSTLSSSIKSATTSVSDLSGP